MIVMPANNSNAHKLAERFPDRLGLLMTPAGRRSPRNLPWAGDNDCFAAWAKSGFSIDMLDQREHWDALAFLDFLVWSKAQETMPRWILAPDVPGNREATLQQFREWRPALKDAGFQVAIAVQDGMTPDDVPEGVVCFVGGTTEWKWRNVRLFCRECERAHVGRVNGYRGLWICHEAGAESVDGTGFFRGDQRQLRGLVRYLEESEVSETRPDRQMLLFEAANAIDVSPSPEKGE